MKRHFIAVCLSIAAVADASSLIVLSPAVDFGELAPDAAPSIASVSVVIRSDAAWRIAVLRDASSRQRAVRAGAVASVAAGNDIRVRSEDGVWTPLPPGIAVPVASGQPSDNPAGVLHAIEFQTTPGMDMVPGQRQIGLHLLLNGQQMADLPLIYSIAAAMKVTADDREFRIITSDPSHNRSYEFEPRVCIVTSNVPWALQAYVGESPKAAGETTSLASDALRVIAIDGHSTPLVAGGQPVVVATGPPTGRAGVPVQVHLAVSAGGAAIEGAYKTQLGFKVIRTDTGGH